MSFNILIVDDSSTVRKVLKRTFSLTDISVGNIFEAENGKVAYELMSREPVDLVFLDVNMPVMNGLEFLRMLRMDEKFRTKKVVVVSTEGSSIRREELEELGIVAYLRKPVTPEILVQTVQTAFAKE